MNLRKAEEMAQEQIKKWCPEYRFRFDKATRRFGCCWGNLKLITLSKTLTEMNDESEVLNTILHEIAHAIAGNNHGFGDRTRTCDPRVNSSLLYQLSYSELWCR